MNEYEELKIIFEKGPVIDLHRAKVGMNLFNTIGEHAERINDSPYSELFFYFQSFSAKALALRTCNLFSTPKQRYPEYSLVYLLDFIDNNASEIPIRNRHYLEKLIPACESATEADCNRALAKRLKQQLPSLKNGIASDDRRISKDFEKARWYRDKWAAHHEITQEESKATVDCFRRLHEVAEVLINTLGNIYTDTEYINEDEGYLLDFDASRPSYSLRYMLEQLRVIESKHP